MCELTPMSDCDDSLMAGPGLRMRGFMPGPALDSRMRAIAWRVSSVNDNVEQYYSTRSDKHAYFSITQHEKALSLLQKPCQVG